jgi:ACS family hexuronate transporter-like MFS transporter
MAGAASGAIFAAVTGNLLAYWEKQGHIQTGYAILFAIAGSAYLIAWVAMRLIAPGMKKVNLSDE